MLHWIRRPKDYVGLVSSLLVLILLVQFLFLAQQAKESERRVSDQLTEALDRTNDLLARLDSIVTKVDKSADHQLGYYENVGRRTQNLLGKLDTTLTRTNTLITNVDLRSERVVKTFEDTGERVKWNVDEIGDAAENLDAAIRDLHKGAQQLLVTSIVTAVDVDNRVTDPRVDMIMDAGVGALLQAEQTLVTTKETMANARDVLAPSNDSFWKRLIKLFIPSKETKHEELD